VRFPGRRKHKHYFPVHARDPLFLYAGLDRAVAKTHVVGIDQTLVDIDARVPDALLARYELAKGASIGDPQREARARLYDELPARQAHLLRVRRRHRRQHAAQLLAAGRRRRRSCSA
jgi:inosine kinase